MHEDFLLGKSIQGARVYLYPHLHFSIGYNNDQIVTANVTMDTSRRVDITDTSVGLEVRISLDKIYHHMTHILCLFRYLSHTLLSGFILLMFITMTV